MLSLRRAAAGMWLKQDTALVKPRVSFTGQAVLAVQVRLTLPCLTPPHMCAAAAACVLPCTGGGRFHADVVQRASGAVVGVWVGPQPPIGTPRTDVPGPARPPSARCWRRNGLAASHVPGPRPHGCTTPSLCSRTSRCAARGHIGPHPASRRSCRVPQLPPARSTTRTTSTAMVRASRRRCLGAGPAANLPPCPSASWSTGAFLWPVMDPPWSSGYVDSITVDVSIPHGHGPADAPLAMHMALLFHAALDVSTPSSPAARGRPRPSP